MKLSPDRHPFLDLRRHRRPDECDQGSWAEVIFGAFALSVMGVIIVVLVMAL